MIASSSIELNFLIEQIRRRLSIGPTCVFYSCLVGSLCYVTLHLAYTVYGDRWGGASFTRALVGACSIITVFDKLKFLWL